MFSSCIKRSVGAMTPLSTWTVSFPVVSALSRLQPASLTALHRPHIASAGPSRCHNTSSSSPMPTTTLLGGAKHFTSIASKNTLQTSPRRSFSQSSLVDTTFQYISISQKGQTLWVTLNRPEIHNAFDEVLIQELKTVFLAIAQEQKDNKDAHLSVRSVVLTGAGASFSAGADLNWMAKMAKYTMEENEADSQNLYDMFAAIKFCPIPVIGRINGAAMGGGTGLISACDMSFAVDSAKFGFTECSLGLIPAVISRFVMEKIGKNNASMYFLTAERFSAAEATRIGLLNAVFSSADAMDARVEEVTKQLSKNSPAAVKEAKRLIEDVDNDSMQLHKSTTRAYLAKKIATVRSSDEGKAGVRAFLDKQKPFWLVANKK